MGVLRRFAIVGASALFLLPAALPLSTHAEEPDAQTIARITGLQPEVKDGIATVRVPRADLAAVVDGVTMDPFQGLTSWAAFQQAGNQTMVMGDLTLARDEVNPAMSAALANGLRRSPRRARSSRRRSKRSWDRRTP